LVTLDDGKIDWAIVRCRERQDYRHAMVDGMQRTRQKASGFR